MQSLRGNAVECIRLGPIGKRGLMKHLANRLGEIILVYPIIQSIKTDFRWVQSNGSIVSCKQTMGEVFRIAWRCNRYCKILGCSHADRRPCGNSYTFDFE